MKISIEAVTFELVKKLTRNSPIKEPKKVLGKGTSIKKFCITNENGKLSLEFAMFSYLESSYFICIKFDQVILRIFIL